jgi:hypothetical protein
MFRSLMWPSSGWLITGIQAMYYADRILVIRRLVDWYVSVKQNSFEASSTQDGDNNSIVFWDVTSCILLYVCRIFYGMYHVHYVFRWLQYKMCTLTLILLTRRIWWAPNNASNWQMGFNSAFKGLNVFENVVPTNTLQSQKGELIKLHEDVFRIHYRTLNTINGVKWGIKGWSAHLACIRVIKAAHNVLA